MLPAKFGSIWPSSFRGEDFFNISQSETRITLRVIALFSSNFQHFNTFRPLFQKLLKINVKFKL
jgi:hypothetical protein